MAMKVLPTTGDAIKVNYAQAISMITKYIKCRLVPMLRGSPGMGKSSIVYQIAAEYNLMVIDLRLSQCDPTDLLGFPNIMGTRAGYVPMNTFPIEGDTLPINPKTGLPYSGWLLFLDEFNAAVTSVQAAAYKLILDRMVGIYHLHKNVAIVCAGNLETDNAIVNPMSTAMQSRMVHMELVPDLKGFLKWCSENGIDHRIPDYINFRPANMYAFSPEHTEHTYACNRTWEFANRVLGVTDDKDPDRLPMLAGTISEGVAREFIGFCGIYQDLPKMAEIEAAPETIKVPEEPSVLWALTGTIAQHVRKDSLNQLMKYVKRMPREMQAVTWKDALRRNQTLLTHPSMIKWIEETAESAY